MSKKSTQKRSKRRNARSASKTVSGGVGPFKKKKRSKKARQMVDQTRPDVLESTVADFQVRE